MSPVPDVVADLAAANSVTLSELVEAWRAHGLVELATLAVDLDRRTRVVVAGTPAVAQADWLRVADAPNEGQRGWLVESVVTQRAEASLERLQRLAELPRDPRDAPALVAIVKARTHQAHDRFWRLLVKLLHQVADARVMEALAGDDDERVAAMLKRPPHQAWPVATARELELLSRIAARLGGTEREKTEDDFLADVWAHPLDDAPREVYGDWLQQRGNPRGELIALQMARHRGNADTAKAERALLVEHGRAWLGPLEGAISNQYSFERGFVYRCKISWRKLAALPALMKHPAWATVREYILDPAGERACDPWLDHMIALGAKRK